jgi:hypothetical protein
MFLDLKDDRREAGPTLGDVSEQPLDRETTMDVARRRELARRALDGYVSGPAAPIRATARALAKVDSAVAVVLVEGISDQIALETAAVCRGRDFEVERVVIVPIGGAHAIGRFLARFGPLRTPVRLAGLCDVHEAEIFRRGLVTANVGSPRTQADLEDLGFYVCVDDLEDELIRAVGTDGSKRSSTRRATSGRSARCRASPPGAAGSPKCRCGGFWAVARAASCATPGCSSRRQLAGTPCRGRSTRCSLPFACTDLPLVER